MDAKENLLSLPWHLLTKKRNATATPAQLAELNAWLARYAPTPPAPRPDEASQAWERMQARAKRYPPKA